MHGRAKRGCARGPPDAPCGGAPASSVAQIAAIELQEIENKLSRTYAVLLDALNRHRGKGQQKVTVEHVHVHSGGQAVVGMVETPGGGSQPKSEEQPMQLPIHPALKCGARTRDGRCQAPAMPNGRCRMHGGKVARRPEETRSSMAATRLIRLRTGGRSGCYCAR